MKKIFSLLLIMAVFAACGGKATDKKSQLVDLKKQQATLSAQITALEKEVNGADTTKKEKIKYITAVPLATTVFRSEERRVGKECA